MDKPSPICKPNLKFTLVKTTTSKMKYFPILDTIMTLSDDQIAFYRENKFIKIKDVFEGPELLYYAEIIKDKVDFLSRGTKALEDRDTYAKAFLQIMNLWTHDDEVKTFTFSKRLASIASQLMEVDGVRMYHDQALFKEPGGGFTPWHADQYYWPLESDKTVTAWIPLQDTPLEMGPLEFSAKSHMLKDGRELKISDDSETIISQKLRLSDFTTVVEPFALGEVSFHSGWVFHRAGANTTNQMRQVMTVIYMDKNMRLMQPKNENQQNDWDSWCPGAEIGSVVDTRLNPVLYP